MLDSLPLVYPKTAAMEGEDEEDCTAAGEAFRRSFVREWAILKEIIGDIVSSGGSAHPDAFKKAQSIIEVYQEQGHLLEPHLDGVICPLMEVLRIKVAKASSIQDVDLEIVKRICRLVHKLITVCGPKTVVKFFPHQASDLEVTVLLLERCHKETKTCTTLEESDGEWETACTLVLWLSILVLIPFDMASVDTALGYSSTTSTSSPLVDKMLSLCKQYLSSPGQVREMSGFLLSRLLTRPDMRSSLLSFTNWAQEAFRTLESTEGFFLVPGTVNALAGIFKIGGRDVLLEISASTWQEVSVLLDAPSAQRSPLLRKLVIKLIQRIGLTYLPPKVASWRYLLGTRSLAQNLDGAQNCMVDVVNNEEDESYEVPELIEDIMEKLLSGLKDKDTVVRWSAAKGIGRVTSRLSSENADDVVASVLELFSPTEGDGAWHGGCLALAELARRGLLLPSRLPEVMPLLINALHYDVRRGPHSVGAHVRDAAAYVCWAFARAYVPAVMNEHLAKLAPEMMAVACYDREVNCRRAASAAFQENVGRQGSFLHGIDIVNVSDYFSIGSRSHAYLHVAPYVAQFEEYRGPLIQDLLQTKIRHWDRGLRELAAVALSTLVKYDPAYFEASVIGSLSTWSLSTDLNLRHGSTLAAAEVTRAVHECGRCLSSDKEKVIAGMVPAIEKARLYRGKGGEIMRAAVSRLIECTALACIPLSTKSKKSLLDTLDENLRHPNGQIQSLAAAGFKTFVRAYHFPVTPTSISCTTSKQLQGLFDANPARRRGSALALGVLPQELLTPLWKEVVDGLCAACLEENVEDRDPEARVNAVRGLASVCGTIVNSGNDLPAYNNVLKTQVTSCLLRALDDYAIDNRGDVGSWIREAAMEALESCTYLLCKHPNTEPPVDERYSIDLFGGLIKQAAEKIDRIRETAGKTLQRLLHNDTIVVPCVPCREELQKVFPRDESLLWSDPLLAFPRLVQVIDIPEYRAFVMAGLVVSIGGISQTLGKVSLAALLDHLSAGKHEEEASPFNQERTGVVAAELLVLLKKSSRNDRLVLPIVKTIDALLSKGAFRDSKSVGNDFATGVFDLLLVELKGCRDVSKILCCVNVLTGIVSLHLQASKPAFRQLLTLLSHRYPKVRKVTAEQLYLLLMQAGEEDFGGDITSNALDMLLETCWDGLADDVKAAKAKLVTLFGSSNEEEAADDAPHSAAAKTSDENASYASLVDSAGY